MDIRDIVFGGIAHEEMTAGIYAEQEGVLSGIEEAAEEAGRLGLTVAARALEGDRVTPGQSVLSISGSPKQMAVAEERLIGLMAKTSGIATAADRFCRAAGENFEVICGAWKKVNISMKESYRKAIVTGGCRCRILDEPMLYLDKNYVAMLGGIREMMENLPKNPEVEERKKVVQIKKRDGDIALACWTAAEYGADVLYVDTGNIGDLEKVKDSMTYMRRIPRIAFAGNVTLADIERLKEYPVNIVGVGKAIIDAPMLDMRFGVVPVTREHKCGNR